MGDVELAGRAALVTGGSSGIGHAVAGSLSAVGVRVAVLGRHAGRLDDATGRLGGEVVPVVADVAEVGAAADTISRVEAAVGPLDIVVHAAGGQVKRPATEQTDAEWLDTLGTHVLGVAALSRHAATSMARRPPIDGGRAIVLIGSMAARIGFADVSAYAAAKGAVTALARVLAVEWAPRGIRVNTVTPGWVDTPLTRRAFATDPAHRERILARTPLGRLGDPDDVAQAVRFLVSPAARFITGADLVVDGGASVAL